MEPLHLLVLALAGVVLAIGFTRRKRPKLAFDDALLDEVKRSLERQGFSIESYEHESKRGTLRTTALGVRLDERVVGTLAPSKDGASASLVVYGMKAPPATFRIGRAGERKPPRFAPATEVSSGDAAFDARYRVNGAPAEGAQASLASTDVRAGLEAVFAADVVVELRVLSLGDAGGAVRVELALPRTRLDALRGVADLARALADALERVS